MPDDGADLIGEKHRGFADNVAFVEDLSVVVDETLQLQIGFDDHFHFQIALVVLRRNLRRGRVGLKGGGAGGNGKLVRLFAKSRHVSAINIVKYTLS